MPSATTEPLDRDPHADPVPRRRRLPGGEGVDWAVMLLGAFALAAVTLAVVPITIGYDPWSWLIWGREIGRLDLDTRRAATAVKPFPIFVNVLLTRAGAAAPVLWLLVARAGALLSLALAFRVGRRFGGAIAGSAAAVGLALADQYFGHLFIAGISDPMTTAAVLAAVDSHLRGHRRRALGFLVVAGLLRPEPWPALILYCLWLGSVGGVVRRVVTGLVAVTVPAVWFLIDLIGSGQLLRSAAVAQHQSQGGPLLSRVPGLAALGETWPLMSGPVLILFVIGFVVALRAWRRSGSPDPLVWIGGAALGWFLIDAVLAQGRLATGAPRYLLPGVGLACVVAGAVVAQLFSVAGERWARRRLSRAAPALIAVVLVAACVPRLVTVVQQVGAGVDDGRRGQILRARLPGAIALAGGRDAILRCGRISTGTFQVPVLAWHLDVPLRAVKVAHPGVSGTIIGQGLQRFSAAELRRYRVLAFGGFSKKSTTWTVMTTCRPH